MAGIDGLRLSSAWIETPSDHSIHCYFNSPAGRVACVLRPDAVELMAPHVGPESAWQIISSLWSDDLTAVAEAKFQHSPQCPLLISAQDLQTAFH